MSTGPTDPEQTGRPDSSNQPPPPTSPYSQTSPYGETVPTYGQPQPPYGQQSQPYGQPPQAYGIPGYVVPTPNDGLAVGALVVGILAFVFTCAYGIGLLGSPVALVMGRMSMKRIDQSQGRLGGRGMATAGFVLGIIGTVLLALVIAGIVVLVVLTMNGTIGSSDY